MNRYFTSLDGLIIASELAALGKHQEAAQFLISATRMPEYREMVQAVTEQQQENKQQEEADLEQQQQEEEASTPELSMALARVLGGNERADTYPDSNVWQDQQEKEQQDMLDQGSVEHASEEDQGGGEDDQQGTDDLGIDLDEQGGEQSPFEEEEQASAVTAALAAMASQAAPRAGIRQATVATATPLTDRQARLARNRQNRA